MGGLLGASAPSAAVMTLQLPSLPPFAPASGVVLPAAAGSGHAFSFHLQAQGASFALASHHAAAGSSVGAPQRAQQLQAPMSPLPHHLSATLRDPAASLLSALVDVSRRQVAFPLGAGGIPASGAASTTGETGGAAAAPVVGVRIIVSSSFPAALTLESLTLSVAYYAGDAVASLAAAAAPLDDATKAAAAAERRCPPLPALPGC